MSGLNLVALSYELAVEEGWGTAITLERVRRRGHPDRWAVRKSAQSVLSVDGEFEYEPMPSSRTEEFYARCRFETVEAALVCWHEHFKRNDQYYAECGISLAVPPEAPEPAGAAAHS